MKSKSTRPERFSCSNTERTHTHTDTGERTQQSSCEHVHERTKCRVWNEGLRNAAHMSCAHVRTVYNRTVRQSSFRRRRFFAHWKFITAVRFVCIQRLASWNGPYQFMRMQISTAIKEVHKRWRLHAVAAHHSTARSTHMVFGSPLARIRVGNRYVRRVSRACVCVLCDVKFKQRAKCSWAENHNNH